MKYNKSITALRLAGLTCLGALAMTSTNAYAAADKVTICHFPPGNIENVQVISIALPAWEAHKSLHGAGDLDDTIFDAATGQCPVPIAATSEACSAQTAGGLHFTIDEPLVQESTVVSDLLTTYDFESVPQWNQVFRAGTGVTTINWDGVGVYEGGNGSAKVNPHIKWGAAYGEGKYLFIYNTEIAGVGESIDQNVGVTLTFDTPVTYFGFWWSAGDYANRLQVTLENGIEYNVETGLVYQSEGFVNSRASQGGHMGSPTTRYLDQNSGEPYAYLNLTSKDLCSKIASVRFHGRNFETDNHTVTTELVSPPGTDIPLLEPPKPPVFGEAGRFNVQEVNEIKSSGGAGGGAVSP